MKKICYATSLALLIVFTGCKTNQALKCPDVASSKSHHAIWAKAPHFRPHNTANTQNSENKVATPIGKNEAMATTANGPAPFELKIPRIATGKLNNDELEGVNSVFQKYSDHKVQIERKENGRFYLKANSNKDVIKLVKTLAGLKKTNPAALADGDAGGHIAIAGGIIGIIAIILSLGPFVSYGAFLLGIIAIILGAVGLRSSRRGWAITGIVLGVLAILFAGIFGIGIYTIVLHI